MPDAKHLIQGWDDSANQILKQEIMKLGVQEKDIQFITERKSRSVILNKYFKTVPQHYKYIFLYDSDIVLDGSNFVKSLVEDMEFDSQIGAAIIPAFQFAENEIPLKLEAPMANAKENYLRNVNFLTTFNVIVFRRSLLNKGQLFDEDIYGSQIIDVSTGYIINKMGYSIVSDLRHCLAHKQSDFVGKNLCYHAIVSRNRQILREKILLGDNWVSIDDYNEKHQDSRIPSVEELSHMSEPKMIEYVCNYDAHGFANCYLGPRFKDLNTINNYYNSMMGIKNKTPDKYKFVMSAEGWGFGI